MCVTSCDSAAAEGELTRKHPTTLKDELIKRLWVLRSRYSHPPGLPFLTQRPTPGGIRPTMSPHALPSHDSTMFDDANLVQELPVTFHPALYLQRRGWILDVMRRENITEVSTRRDPPTHGRSDNPTCNRRTLRRQVLDIGCGEGELLSCLCNPARWLAPPPPDALPPDLLASPKTTSALEELHQDLLHPTRIAGLDICRADLECAARITKPPACEPEGKNVVLWHSAPVRWEPLQVEIWEGSLEDVNPAFVGIECIVAAEVIEHLHEDVLARFAPVVFGAYHPRVVLVTTPSFTFNARFTAPDAPPAARSGWRDPTGRTGRIFRHHDHKFEWTVEEFEEWCGTIAGEWGYTVEVGGVGKAREVDEWGRDDALGWASQVTEFTRVEGEEWAKRRAELWKATESRQPTAKPQGGHTLFASHQHAVHKAARAPKSMDAVGELVVSRMLYYRETAMTLNDVWAEREVELSCGGWVDWLVRAIQEHPSLSLRKTLLASRIDPEWIIDLDPTLHHLIPPAVTRDEMWPSPPDTEELVDPEDADDGAGWGEDGNVVIRDGDWESRQEGWGTWGEDCTSASWGEVEVNWEWGKVDSDGDAGRMSGWKPVEDNTEGTGTRG
ncbi:hypothetical protein GSI_02425 [Ganoderma sinense ZZ0214-1]|uniref:Small RNA 2'-O-methyltransferase n=1 Tax=Ganoderma sinense ZZ0214-1 TaxID=1077348 RepID=A0A2G8SPK6_9APHY|nr:hypothetical protein GSI_02425 [Ganoderma sinense ZZ0214-1]